LKIALDYSPVLVSLLSLLQSDPNTYCNSVKEIIRYSLEVSINLETHQKEGNVTEISEIQHQCVTKELNTTGEYF
jgi:hypothetical protein